MYRKTIVFDFDGVVHSYKSGWCGIDVIPDKPVEGIKDVINELRDCKYEVVIVSTRCITKEGIIAIDNWLERNNIIVDKVLKEKPPAIVYIDDRAIRFTGKTEGLVEEIKNFKNWLNK